MTYDYHQHVDQSIIEAEAAKLAKITARRHVAATRHAEAVAAHASATEAHKLALAGHTDDDPFETQAAVNAAKERIDVAKEAVAAVEGAITNAEFEHLHGCGKAYEPMHRIAIEHLHEAARKADAGRVLLSEAETQWKAASDAMQSAVMRRSGVQTHGRLQASSESLSVDAKFVIPTEAEMENRRI